MLRLIREPGLPNHLTGRRQGRRAVGPEVHVDAVSLENRRRRRKAVLGIDFARVLQAKHFDVDDLAALLDVERQRPQDDVALVHRRCQPDTAAGDDGRRPAHARHRRLPDDVLRLAPVGRQARARRNGPVRRAREMPASPARPTGPATRRTDQRAPRRNCDPSRPVAQRRRHWPLPLATGN